MEKEYGYEMCLELLATFKSNYIDGLRSDPNAEKALFLVEKEDYMYYDKGALAMYELQRLVGEDAVNLALKNFLLNESGLESDAIGGSFNTSSDLVAYLKAELAHESKYLVDELLVEIWEIGDCFDLN